MRTTYVLDPKTRKLVPKKQAKLSHMGVLPDIKDFQTTDGAHIKGRAGLKEYQRRTGMEQIGNDTVNGLDEQGGFQRKVEEMPPVINDVMDAWRKHS